MAYYGRGNIHYIKKYEKAINDFSKSIKLKPDFVYTWYQRGNVWYDLQEFDKAIVLDPKFELAYLDRGYAWFDKHNYDKAIQDYSQVIKLNPQHVNAYRLRGDCWDEKKEHERALKDYHVAVKLKPMEARNYINRGCVYAALKKTSWPSMILPLLLASNQKTLMAGTTGAIPGMSYSYKPRRTTNFNMCWMILPAPFK
ncbi:tetratricopeptide repeat protein [Paraflavitalea speifideaquila]|uniref:tetratricopeptide repeat protein n=1 Tax=Paraflavitalea speifideaquila TaxID=3076558 RepID=UPI0028E214F6|nr:tetratricopeptide repeat protein [Paraflavitalea speifideiaquila]